MTLWSARVIWPSIGSRCSEIWVTMRAMLLQPSGSSYSTRHCAMICVDMRAVLPACGRDLPDPLERLVGEPQAAVGAEHRDAFLQWSRVSRCTSISAL